MGGVVVEGGASINWWEESLLMVEPELVGESVNLGDSCFRTMKIWRREL